MTALAAQAALVAFLASVVAALSRAYAAPHAWWLLAPAAASLLWRPARVPQRVRAVVESVSWALVAATAAYGLAWSLYPVIPERLVASFPRIAGPLLAGLASFFALGSRIWTPGRAALPTGLAALVVAAFQTAPGRRPEATLAWAAAALAAYLVFDRDVGGATASVGESARRLVVAAGFCAASAVLALGLIRLLPAAQPHVEQAVAGILDPSAGNPVAGLSSSSRLGEIEQVALSHRVVMRVWSSRAQRLRGRVFGAFDGRTWQALPSKAVDLVPAPDADPLWGGLKDVPGTSFVAPGRPIDAQDGPTSRPSLVATRVVQEALTSGTLLAPPSVVGVRLAASRLRIEPFGVLLPSGSGGALYGILNWPRGAPAAWPAPESDLAPLTAVPPGLDPRLRELASGLARGTASDAERVRRTVGFLETCCHYSLAVGRFHSAQPVGEFLFEKKRGYCEYFASAAVLLLRLQGVPARYVTGFNVQETNWESDHYVVRESDAHAWIEAYVDGVGWIEADPTPAAEYAALHTRPRRGAVEAALESVRALWAELSARLGAGDWKGALAAAVRAAFPWVRRRPWTSLLVAVALAVGGRRWWRRGRGRPPRREAGRSAAIDPRLAELMAGLDAAWARRGCPRPAARTPLEHLGRLPAGRFAPEAVAGARRFVDGFYRARYGGGALEPHDLRSLREDLAAFSLDTRPSLVGTISFSRRRR